MPSELPIACTLSAGELAQRLAKMADLGRAALIDARTGSTLARLRFAARAGVRGRLEAIVAAESQCCAFLQMRIGDEPDTVILTIDAPRDAELVLANSSTLSVTTRTRSDAGDDRAPSKPRYSATTDSRERGTP